MSEFREKIGNFYVNHEKGLQITRNVAGWVSGIGMILLLGFAILGIVGGMI